MKPVRIQKYLSNIGIVSRRTVEKMIESGQIYVNDKQVELGTKVTDKDLIVVSGKKITKKLNDKKILIAFYKPIGVETTMKKMKKSKTLADYNFHKNRLFPVGRLDKESRGLLLMTNDGELANKLTHPRYEHEKEYIVTVDKRLTPKMIYLLSNGTIKLCGRYVKKAKIKKIDTKKFIIILKEGRNRQIRKMCKSVNLEVLDLFRTRIANIKIGNLKPGEFIELSIHSELFQKPLKNK